VVKVEITLISVATSKIISSVPPVSETANLVNSTGYSGSSRWVSSTWAM